MGAMWEQLVPSNHARHPYHEGAKRASRALFDAETGAELRPRRPQSSDLETPGGPR